MKPSHGNLDPANKQDIVPGFNVCKQFNNQSINSRKHKEENEKNDSSGINQTEVKTGGIFVGRIPKTTRVRELKDAILSRSLRANNLVWKGFKGFAFLYFDKENTNLSADEICL